MKRTLVILSVIFIFSLTLSSVQAADLNQSTNFTSQQIVSENTFESIQNAIDNSNESDTILLEGTYVSSGSEITIDKSLTIRGTNGGATLSGNKTSRIFNIVAGNVVIENLAFVNGYDYSQGGAIYCEGDDVAIRNCNFTSNSVSLYGAAMLSVADNMSITGCQFVKNTASYTGGAFELQGDNCYVDNCLFSDNKAGHVGGSIAWVGNNGTVKNSIFKYSLGSSGATQFGGAIAWMGANGTVESSLFDRNMAKKSGAAIYWRGVNGSLNYCIFTNNTSANDIAYYGNSDYVGANYWGENINSDEDFLNGKFMYYNDTFHVPQNWVNLVLGDYTVDFKLNDGSDLTGYLPDYETTALNTKIVIFKNHYKFKKPSKIVASNKVTYNNGEYFKITLKDVNNKKIANKYVQITVNKVSYKVKTDKNGVASLKLKTLAPKSYSVKIVFAGDGDYKKSSKTVKLTVKKQKTSFKISKNSKSKTIKITLKNQFKKVLSKKLIKLTINKKTYKVKTNKKGVATFKLKLKTKKNYKFTAKFGGSKYLSKITKKGSFKI